MQILYTYTKLPVYKRLDGRIEELTAPKPSAMHHWEPPISQPYLAAGDRPVTWRQTGKFIECNGCIVFQWQGYFDHEREAENIIRKERLAKLKRIGKRDDAWKDDLLESEGPPSWEPTNGGSDGPWHRVD